MFLEKNVAKINENDYSAQFTRKYLGYELF